MNGAEQSKAPPRFQRLARLRRQDRDFYCLRQTDCARPGKNVQDVRAGLKKQSIRITNRPAKFPPTSVWPLELRADMAAALLDFDTTRQLCKAILEGNAPRPSGVRGVGARAEPVWSFYAVKAFVAARHQLAGHRDDTS
jgi:hypothetical protein